MKITKTSANTKITDGNTTCYDLAGAEYTVYSDKEATKEVGKVTLDGSGTGELSGIKAGTYYVKESKAPKGYALDEGTHEVTVTSGQTAELAVKDVPQNDPAFMKVQKVDAETGKASALGAGTLAGAEFTVSYYDGFYTKDTLPEKATRTWVLKTTDNGVTSLARAASDKDSYLASGDEFYTNSFG